MLGDELPVDSVEEENKGEGKIIQQIKFRVLISN